jgi:DNA-binding transcriptional LysR family regulator
MHRLFEPSDTVHLSCSPGTSHAGLSIVLARFVARFPHVRVVQGTTNRSVNLVDEGIDIAVRAHQEPSPTPVLCNDASDSHHDGSSRRPSISHEPQRRAHSTESRTPEPVDDSAIACHRDRGHVVPGVACLAMSEGGLEHLVTCARRTLARRPVQKTVVGKFFGERERALRDALLDVFKARVGTRRFISVGTIGSEGR